VKDIVIIDGARTAFGTYGGALRDTSATDLGVIAAKGALEKSKVDPKQIDQVIFGNVLQTSGDAVYLARSQFYLDYTRERAPGIVFTDVKDVKAAKAA